MTDIIRNALEIIGTIAFAISGSLVAIGAGLDIFGVAFIAATTAVGGGIIRDIIIGSNPPNAFLNPTFILIAVAVSVFVFTLAYIKRSSFLSIMEKIERINNFFDALGLAAFSVAGAQIAILSGHADNVFIVATLGTVTGIGGGILRDILTNTTPYVLKKHVYASASLLGTLLYYYLNKHDSELASISAMLIIIAIRMLAAKYRWSLPKIDVKNEK